MHLSGYSSPLCRFSNWYAILFRSRFLLWLCLKERDSLRKTALTWISSLDTSRIPVSSFQTFIPSKIQLTSFINELILNIFSADNCFGRELKILVFLCYRFSEREETSIGCSTNCDLVIRPSGALPYRRRKFNSIFFIAAIRKKIVTRKSTTKSGWAYKCILYIECIAYIRILLYYIFYIDDLELFVFHVPLVRAVLEGSSASSASAL